jgi:hypothetical protein
MTPSVGGGEIWVVGLAVIVASGIGVYTLTDDGGRCKEFQLSPATAGDTYEYEGKGTVLLSSNKGIVGDWGTVDSSDEQGAIEIGSMGRMEVQISSEPRKVVSLSGADRSAFQVSYLVSDASHDSALHVADEWLGASRGETIESRMPSVSEEDGRVLHHRHFTRTGWAGLLHAPDLWNQSIVQGEHWSVTFEEGFPNTRDDRSEVSVSFTVTDVRQRPDGCEARIEVIHPYANATLTVSEGRPVPIDYRAQAGEFEFELSLEGYEAGDGPQLTPVNRTGKPPSSLGPLEPLENDFLPDAEGVFATNWSQALAAIKEDEQARRWLDNHPNAAVTDIRYVQGKPDSRIENRWTATWWPGPKGGESMENHVTTRSNPGSRVIGNDIDVRTSMDEELPSPEITETVPLSSLADLHSRIYGSELETIHCNFSSPPQGSSCLMGPHDATGRPRAGGAGVFHSGTIVGLRTGHLLQETSFAEYIIDPPAQGR